MGKYKQKIKNSTHSKNLKWIRQKDAEEKAKVAKSVLDIDPEARAILEMTGKERKSEGLRELPPDEEARLTKKPVGKGALNVDPETKAMLEMAGRENKSDNIRNAPNPPDPDE